MSLIDTYKTRLNTSLATLSQTDMRLMFKDLYEQITNLRNEVTTLHNEARELSKDRTKVNRVVKPDVSST